VPESGKRAVLLSGDAWCIPPRNVQSYVGELMEHGNIAEAISILQNYAACADSEDADARKKTAVGLSEMAELYAKADPKLLSEALRHVGLRLSVEQDSELQGLVSAAFVRLSQEAATSRYFPAMEQALDLLAGVESQRPGIARSLRGKMGIEERVPEFVEEALKARQVAAGLTDVLRLLPQTTMEQLSARFNRCSLRDDSEHVANLAADMGEEAVQYLRSTVRGGPIAEAVEMAGLLSRLDPESVMVFQPQELRIAALQALEKLDPDWVRDYLPKSGIDKEDFTLAPLEIPVSSKFVRQRRHTRVRLQKPVKAVSINLTENCSLEIKTASLSGGVATISRHLPPGTQVQLKLQLGMRNLQATALMRDYRAQDMAFEIVDMNLEERSKYRRLLAGSLQHSVPTVAESDVTPEPVGVAGSK